MQILKDDDIHLKFLLGLPVHIDGIGNFRSPYLTQIVDLTEEIYNMSISTIFFDKSQIKDQNLEQYSNFEVLSSVVLGDEIFRNLFLHALTLHIDTPPLFHPEGFIYFGELSMDSILTEEKFEYVKRLVRIANNLSEQKKEDEFNAGNEQARELIERIKRNRQKNKPKQLINLHSIISAVGWKHSFDFISELNIYQLYNGYQRLGYIDNYNFTMTGIYSGTVDSSKIKLADFNFANIIK